MRKRKRQLWHKTPWDGQPGIWAAWRRFLYQIEGPSQLGRRDEPAPVVDPHPKCPICKALMSEHEIYRGGPNKSTRIKCPTPQAEVQSVTTDPSS